MLTQQSFNVAILCSTWAEMQKCAELAQRVGLLTHEVSEIFFRLGANVFAQYKDAPDYTNVFATTDNKVYTTPFATFIAGLVEVGEWVKCVKDIPLTNPAINGKWYEVKEENGIKYAYGFSIEADSHWCEYFDLSHPSPTNPDEPEWRELTYKDCLPKAANNPDDDVRQHVASMNV